MIVLCVVSSALLYIHFKKSLRRDTMHHLYYILKLTQIIWNFLILKERGLENDIETRQRRDKLRTGKNAQTIFYRESFILFLFCFYFGSSAQQNHNIARPIIFMLFSIHTS